MKLLRLTSTTCGQKWLIFMEQIMSKSLRRLSMKLKHQIDFKLREQIRPANKENKKDNRMNLEADKTR